LPNVKDVPWRVTALALKAFSAFLF
jgi:hypothetical protein